MIRGRVDNAGRGWGLFIGTVAVPAVSDWGHSVTWPLPIGAVGLRGPIPWAWTIGRISGVPVAAR